MTATFDPDNNILTVKGIALPDVPGEPFRKVKDKNGKAVYDRSQPKPTAALFAGKASFAFRGKVATIQVNAWVAADDYKDLAA